ncbi:hypothetical protein E0K89_001940 [Aquicoccus sp. SCR17]|nr:hypothetical protein [Carideicomes alvinocaridis]
MRHLTRSAQIAVALLTLPAAGALAAPGAEERFADRPVPASHAPAEPARDEAEGREGTSRD